MYAVKCLKGKEYMYSKELVIELGKRSKKTLEYAIDSLNALKDGKFACKENETWRICDDVYMCKNYAEYKAIIGKNGFRVKAI